MFTVKLYNKTESTFWTYNHVDKIIYQSGFEEYVLTEENMLSHVFLLGHDLHIFSQDSNCTVSHELIGIIEITRE